MTALVAKLGFDESFAESLGRSGDERAVEVSREIVHAVLLWVVMVVVMVVMVGGGELGGEFGAMERGEEVSVGGEGGRVRGGGKDKSRVIFSSVEIGVVLERWRGREGPWARWELRATWSNGDTTHQSTYSLYSC